MMDFLLALVEHSFGGTALYIPTILVILAIGICVSNEKWLQMPRYMLGTVISESIFTFYTWIWNADIV